MILRLTALAALLLTGAAAPPPGACVFVGTQGSGPGQGIFASRLDLAVGTLAPARLVAEAPRPTWVLADPAAARLYATSDPREAGARPQVLAYAVERPAGTLRPIGAADSGGQGPTFLGWDARSRTLAVAHYGSGQVSALPVGADGKPGTVASIQADSGTGPSPRQASPHAHAAVFAPGGRFVLVPDLGADRVFVYRFDPATRALSPAATPSVALPPGSGPRHLVFGRDGRFAYLVSELSAEVRAYRFDAVGGALREVQVLPLAAPGQAAARSGAEIALSPDGAHLYVSERGDNAIVVFAVDRRTGMLVQTQRVPAGGRTPWHIAFDPTGRWLLVANQGSDEVAVFAADRRTGRLVPTGATIAIPKPVSVALLQGC